MTMNRFIHIEHDQLSSLPLFPSRSLSFILHWITIWQSLSRQTSLVEDRIDDSDEDEFREERSGMSKKRNSHKNMCRNNTYHVMK